MKVYICIAGEYSDSHVVAAFLNKERADKAAAALNWDVEELDLDEVNPDDWPIGKRAYTACLTLEHRVPTALEHVGYRDSTTYPPLLHSYSEEAGDVRRTPPKSAKVNYVSWINDAPTGWTDPIGKPPFENVTCTGSFWAADNKEAERIAWEKLNELVTERNAKAETRIGVEPRLRTWFEEEFAPKSQTESSLCMPYGLLASFNVLRRSANAHAAKPETAHWLKTSGVLQPSGLRVALEKSAEFMAGGFDDKLIVIAAMLKVMGLETRLTCQVEDNTRVTGGIEWKRPHTAQWERFEVP